MPTPEIDPPVLRIAAAMLVRSDGRTLLVRKRHTTMFMQPGGKIDPGETTQSALVRELNEEPGISVDIESLVPLGQFSTPAANEAGVMVDAALFMVEAIKPCNRRLKSKRRSGSNPMLRVTSRLRR
jgi:8-oxo-dGTP pyrophosphatase MutT (NUDIX family)